MNMIKNYSDLKLGDVLSKGDTLVLHGLGYEVVGSNLYWLSLSGGINSEVFKKLGRYDDRHKWAKQFEERISENSAEDFPVFRSLENLTRFVIAIYETPGYDSDIDKASVVPNKVTYSDLINGYILQDGDVVYLAGIKYYTHARGNFLYTKGNEDWDLIFKILCIDDKDKFCSQFGKLARKECRFPEFETAEGLTKCVIELMERAEHIPVLPEPFAVSMDYNEAVSEGDLSSTAIDSTDSEIRLPKVIGNYKIIL